MSDTPETDANDDAWAYDVQYGTFNALMDNPVEWREFARRLERERNALKAEAYKYIELWDRATKELESLKSNAQLND